jgi:pimeloyl-ACP methyl ester carboxylesterase
MMSLADTWWQIGPALAARGWEATALDLAGHGSSPALGRPLDLDALVAGVDAGLPDPVDVLVGHSLGAVTALAFAGRRPDAVRALVLEDPPGGDLGDTSVLKTGVLADAELVRTDRAAIVRREREANPGWRDEDVEHSVDGIAAADAGAVAAGRFERDLPALLAGVRVPVLVLAAPASPGTFVEDGGSALRAPARREIEARATRFVVLPGGHCLHRDLPGEWLAAFDDFAAGRPAPPR